MHIKKIKCNKYKNECIYVLFSLFLLFLISFSLLSISSSNKNVANISNNEILNTKLTYNENLIYSELRNFAFSYETLKDDNKLDITNLKDTLFIEPFYAENNIEKSYSWELLKNDNFVAYIGRSNKNADLVLMYNIKDNSYDVYYEKHIKKGISIDRILKLKKIVAYTANEYRKGK